MLPRLGHAKVTQREFPNMVKTNIYEHWTRVTRLNPLWVSGLVWTPIWSWYETLNFRDRRGVASLRQKSRRNHRYCVNRNPIRYVFPAGKKLSFIIWKNKELKEQLEWPGWEEKKSKTRAFSIYIYGENVKMRVDKHDVMLISSS